MIGAAMLKCHRFVQSQGVGDRNVYVGESGAALVFQLNVLTARRYCNTKAAFMAQCMKDEMKQPHGRMSTKWAPHDGGHPM